MSNMRETFGPNFPAESQHWSADNLRSADKPSLLSAQTLRQAALRLADLKRGASSLNTRDLVGLLVSHAARSRRLHQPRAYIHINTPETYGKRAIRLHIG